MHFTTKVRTYVIGPHNIKDVFEGSDLKLWYRGWDPGLGTE